MQDIISTDVDSITTDHIQTLCIGKKEAEQMRGKKVLIVDDVISTGESLKSIEKLVNQVDGNIVGRMAPREKLRTGRISFIWKNYLYLMPTEA